MESAFAQINIDSLGEVPYPFPEEWIGIFENCIDFDMPKFDTDVTEFPKNLDICHSDKVFTNKEPVGDVATLVGGTPIVKLNILDYLNKNRPDTSSSLLEGEIYGKLEMMNPSGNVKDRPALFMLNSLNAPEGDFIVEATSGNTGLSLCLLSGPRKLKMIIMMPDKISKSRVGLVKACGAQVIITDSKHHLESPKSHIGRAILVTRIINTVNHEIMKRKGKNADCAFVKKAHNPNQYINQHNIESHYYGTGIEIVRQMQMQMQMSDKCLAFDYFVAGIGTGGTATGCGMRIKKELPQVKIVAVEPTGSTMSPLLSKTETAPYVIEGIGHDSRPPCVDKSVYDEWIQVPDKTSAELTRLMCQTEGLLLGGSCGTAVGAAIELIRRKPKSKVLVILPDSGRGYLETIFNDDFLRLKNVMPQISHAKSVTVRRFVDDNPHVLESCGKYSPETPVSVALESNTRFCFFACLDSNGAMQGIVPARALASAVLSQAVGKNDPIKKLMVKYSFVTANEDDDMMERFEALRLHQDGGHNPDSVIFVREGCIRLEAALSLLP